MVDGWVMGSAPGDIGEEPDAPPDEPEAAQPECDEDDADDEACGGLCEDDAATEA